MKPITWLRKFAARGFQGYPMATLAFYGPGDRKASKVVLGIIEFEGGEPVLHKWVRDTADKDLRYADEIDQFCQEKGNPNDSKARARLAAHKARSGSRQ